MTDRAEREAELLQMAKSEQGKHTIIATRREIKLNNQSMRETKGMQLGEMIVEILNHEFPPAGK